MKARSAPLLVPTGFREYDARWRFDEEIDLDGARRVGLALARMVHEDGRPRRIVVGHDHRSYAESVKTALVDGLVAGGLHVLDIGLALTPMAYLARVLLDAPALAMVTASHNPNGWTGFKMGLAPPFTFLPEQMARLRDLALAESAPGRPGGRVETIDGLLDLYIQDVVGEFRLSRPLRVVVACGNGTACIAAPEAVRRMGAEVVEMDAELDWTFPRHDPNPEDPRMQAAMAERVKRVGADIGLGFDGDGDRLGVVDDEGAPLHADIWGLLLARDLSQRNPGATFLVDLKSTGLFAADPVLEANGCRVVYGRTGHSYMKQALVAETALAAFERSGHVFLAPPLGRGYDDALAAARLILDLVDRSPAPGLSGPRRALPPAFASPTLGAACADGDKYRIAADIGAQYQDLATRRGAVLGRRIRRVVNYNGARVELEDGSWLLVRASSNTPEIVVVVESRCSPADRDALFHEEVAPRLAAYAEVGAWRGEP